MNVKRRIVDKFDMEKTDKTGVESGYENPEETIMLVPRDIQSIMSVDITEHEEADTVVECESDGGEPLTGFTAFDDEKNRRWVCIKREYWNRLCECVEGGSESSDDDSALVDSATQNSRGEDGLTPTLRTDKHLPVVIHIKDCDWKVVITPFLHNSGFSDSFRNKPNGV